MVNRVHFLNPCFPSHPAISAGTTQTAPVAFGNSHNIARVVAMTMSTMNM